MTRINCPKCPGELSRRVLVGVTVDQCGKCRGIFLDRGELEQLLEAEHRWTRGQDGGYTGGRRRREGADTLEDLEPQSEQYHGERRRRQADFLDEIFE
ncbi:zf-TFIIB domain-containing protein [Marinactinospora rubrisoli]|uniref:Zf-TFIIB domain-containing protein n=1 Tax=Marinactinospora rubrisoli TaxID=2715399 RepID=A0ABW2KMZ3_9ACTN